MIIQNDPRRWRERADGSMVNEDHSSMANLSTQVKIERIPHHEVPENPSAGDIPGFGRPQMDMMSMAFYGSIRGKR